jgi:hypothetical protein
LLEEYNQKALARIAVAILRNLENKLLAGNIRKLLMELMLRKFRLELRKQNIAGICEEVEA